MSSESRDETEDRALTQGASEQNAEQVTDLVTTTVNGSLARDTAASLSNGRSASTVVSTLRQGSHLTYNEPEQGLSPSDPATPDGEMNGHANGVIDASEQEIMITGDRSEPSTTRQRTENSVVYARQNLIQLHESMRSQLAEVRERSEHRRRETRAILHDGMRRIQEAMRSTDLIFPDPETPETIRQLLAGDFGPRYEERSNQEFPTQRNDRAAQMIHREQSRVQSRAQVAANNVATDTRRASVAAGSNPVASNESTRSVNGSQTVRRDLERALRDYRITRRASRPHHSSENTTSADQHNPTYQGVLAQLAEQQNNNRNRMRARGQSRSNTLERVDATINRRVPSGGNAAEIGTSEHDVEFREALGFVETHALAVSRLMPTDSTSARQPYLGPTSSAGLSTNPAGGMRDFYRRVEEQERVRERNARRTTTGSVSSSSQSTRPPSLDLQGNNLVSPVGSTSRSTTRNSGMTRQQRVQDTLDRLNGTLPTAQRQPSTTSSDLMKSRAQNILKYLSELKNLNNDGDSALALAKALGIDSLAESLARESDFDLPIRINELPRVQYSSWMNFGMSWKGVQKGGMVRSHVMHGSAVGGFGDGPLFESGNIDNRLSQLRALNHRNRLRTEQRSTALDADNGLANVAGVGDLSNTPREAGAPPVWSQPETEEEQNLLNRHGIVGTDSLADVERYLSDLLQEEHRRAGRNRGNSWRINSVSFRPRSHAQPMDLEDRGEPKDQWPVQVTLHEVDWENMTLCGTMIASQIATSPRAAVGGNDQISSVADEDQKKDKEEPSSDMQTFFDGEIIDFRTHELETVPGKPGYVVGGPMNDIKYWSQIGPFKTAIAKKVQDVQEKRAKDVYLKFGISGTTLDEQRTEYRRTFGDQSGTLESLDKGELSSLRYDTMVECLGSRKWLEKACGEGGWIFMRWKERCFVTPPSSRPSSSSSGPGGNDENPRFSTTVHRPRAIGVYTTSYDDDRHHDGSRAWGLTIQGFYYVALHRMSGRIEALYFDSGSQPYQELSCTPADSITTKPNDEAGDSVFKDLGEIGIRSNFGSFEFR